MKRLLDPAVGTGILLEPFFAGKEQRKIEIIAVDRDSKPLSGLRQRFAPRCFKLKTVAADFLFWAKRFKEENFDPFDCVVMNPPFLSRREHWVSLKPFRKIADANCENLPAKTAIEAAFVLMALELLRPGGRLLGILPASLIATPTFAWFREYISAKNTIRQVHELPRFSFPGIGSRIYLVVLEKGRESKRTLLLNHDLSEPERRVILRTKFSERLDFAYHQARSDFRKIRKVQNLKWSALEDVAEVIRGSETAPRIARSVVHSTDFVDGFWQKSVLQKKKRGNKTGKVRVQLDDILVKRVSRNCAKTFGIPIQLTGALCSDCVFVIRPVIKEDTLKILFSLRCLFAIESAVTIIERGTGAAYLSKGGLQALSIPVNLFENVKPLYRRYKAAAKKRDFDTMLQIEKGVAVEIKGERAH
jgi:tRNA1(Val) A37 N6-methylase TrmN6